MGEAVEWELDEGWATAALASVEVLIDPTCRTVAIETSTGRARMMTNQLDAAIALLQAARTRCVEAGTLPAAEDVVREAGKAVANERLQHLAYSRGWNRAIWQSWADLDVTHWLYEHEAEKRDQFLAAFMAEIDARLATPPAPAS